MSMSKARRERRKAAAAQRLQEAPRRPAEKVSLYPWGPGLYFFGTDEEAKRVRPPAKLKCGCLVAPEQLEYFEKTGCVTCSLKTP